jgi:hypothetical protein
MFRPEMIFSAFQPCLDQIDLPLRRRNAFLGLLLKGVEHVITPANLTV